MSSSRGIVRAMMLMAWCLVLWGTLIALATAWSAVTQGLGAAWQQAGRLSPLNQFLALASVLVWLLVVWGVALGRAEPN